MVQMYAGSRFSSLKAIYYVACSAGLVSLKFLKRLCRVLIDRGLTLLSFLIVVTSVTSTDAEEFRCCIETVIHLFIVPLFEELPWTGGRWGRDSRQRILCKAMQKTLHLWMIMRDEGFKFHLCKAMYTPSNNSWSLLRNAGAERYVQRETRWDILSVHAMSNKPRYYFLYCTRHYTIWDRQVQFVWKVERAAWWGWNTAEEKTKNSGERKQRTAWNRITGISFVCYSRCFRSASSDW